MYDSIGRFEYLDYFDSLTFGLIDRNWIRIVQGISRHVSLEGRIPSYQNLSSNSRSLYRTVMCH